MAQGVETLRWDHTATLWAALVEPHRNSKVRSEPFTPLDIHPYRSTSDVETSSEPSTEAEPPTEQQKRDAEQFYRTLDRVLAAPDETAEQLLERMTKTDGRRID